MKKSTLRAFQPSENHRNVVLKLGKEFGPYGTAFHRAGRSLAQPFLEGHSRAQTFLEGNWYFSDFDGLPVVYLYRHALELHLKGIILAGNDLMEQEGKGLTETQLRKLLNRGHGHHLSHLLPFVLRVFSFVNWSNIPEDYAPIKTLDDIQALVADIDRVDPGSFAFRYPTDRDYNESPLKDVRGKVGNSYPFSVIEFVKVMDPLVQLLGHSVNALEEWASYRYDPE